ncbi:PEP-CTERM sorting domain-containing protein [Aquincola sp. S2]|uniref:PEP-CTERM sorting domain-containing protein n=1 Tax=Pseudaquabacterium terrae TaxID=2732868 RepID=A0ABX2EKC8_9BURK|nr:PEP-CTERM sorting domain-containing protein [Aquabacterium terrae]NRF69092.1 PEP-CTERM sorting domain-containing protein [Aquabacterium terrae]
MRLEALKRSAIGLAVAAAALAAAPAQAGIVSVDVSGIFSNDELGDAINEVRQVAVGAWQNIVKISWNVELFADSPSWLSEMSVDMAGHNGAGVTLTPGFADDAPGANSYVGSFDLLLSGDKFQVGANGLLRLEFFESFDDFANDWDGIWRAGNIVIETVPEPATYGLMGLALLAAGAATRRRR